VHYIIRAINVILLITCMLLQSCYSPSIKLSDKEETFIDSLSVSLNCKTKLFHMYSAVKENRTDGILSLQISYPRSPNICDEDSSYLKNLSIQITKNLLPVLNHKSNYTSIEIEFATLIQVDDRSQDQTCTKIIALTLAPPYDAHVIAWYQTP